jgi:hypothetical protein
MNQRVFSLNPDSVRTALGSSMYELGMELCKQQKVFQARASSLSLNEWALTALVIADAPVLQLGGQSQAQLRWSPVGN